MYYVTIYSRYPIYEPAEGGYYYSGIQVMDSSGYNEFKKAKRCLRKLYKQCIADGDHQDKYWFSNGSHTHFGVGSKYIGEGWYVKLERRKGKDVSGWEPYC